MAVWLLNSRRPHTLIFCLAEPQQCVTVTVTLSKKEKKKKEKELFQNWQKLMSGSLAFQLPCIFAFKSLASLSGRHRSHHLSCATFVFSENRCPLLPLSSPLSRFDWAGLLKPCCLTYAKKKKQQHRSGQHKCPKNMVWFFFYFCFLNLNGGILAWVAGIDKEAIRRNFEVESWSWRWAAQLFLASLNWWDTLVAQKCNSCGAAVNKPALRWFVRCNGVKVLDFSQWTFQRRLSFSGVNCWSILRTVWVFIRNKLACICICICQPL